MNAVSLPSFANAGGAVQFVTSPVYALCTTAATDQDYRQADIVVRALVTAETTATDDEPNAEFKNSWGEYSPARLSKLRVLEIFKGKPGQSVKLFQTLGSGRFDAQQGKEYLFFISDYPITHTTPSVARGATFVRRACGQSKLWKAVSSTELTVLEALRRAR